MMLTSLSDYLLKRARSSQPTERETSNLHPLVVGHSNQDQ